MTSVLRSTIKSNRKRKSGQCFCGCEQVHASHNSSKTDKTPTETNPKLKKDESKELKKTFNSANNSIKDKKSTTTNKVPKAKIRELKVLLTRFDLEKKKTKTNESVSQVSFKLPQAKLRRRKTVKYDESSLDSTISDEEQDKIPKTKKVLIYRQLPKIDAKKQKRDQYEFESDTEKTKKRRKLNDSSIGYEIPTKNKKRKKLIKVQKPKKVTIKKVVTKKTKNNNIELKSQPEPVEIKKPEPQPVEPTPENNFNFCEVEEDTPPRSPRVKILSNIQLQPRNELNISVASPGCFRDGNPDANSTMIVPSKVLTPWRFNEINITRNPHFISIKDSSLPRIDQELVLNHTMVDKLNNFIKTDNENRVQKILKQSKLNDFLKCRDTDKENLENSQLSLFDVDQFSPIKSRNGISNNVESVKRQILGEIHENNQMSPARSIQAITPPKTPNFQDSNNDSNTDFGFDSTGNESPVKTRTEKPFRLSICVTDRKYNRKPKRYFRKEESLPSSSEDESEIEEEEVHRQINLFDDFADTQEVIEEQEEKTAKIKKTRKQRKHEKKQKNVRTKEEEAEAEKWAAAFNSMCEEIDKFPLEIE